MIPDDYATLWRQAKPVSSGIIRKTRNLLRHAALSVASALNTKSEDHFLRGLYCHGVFDDQKGNFEHLILKLKSTGQFVDTDTCFEMLQGRKPIDRRYFHLSFDDGFRNNFTNALPILIRHKVPAIFFVPSSLIEANWNQTRIFCTQTTHYSGVIEMLKWQDLKEVLLSGYEIGSHTRNHVRFSKMSHDPAILEDEILGSKNELEDRLNYECKYISWPYGRLTDADAQSLQTVKNARYTACFGAYRGTMQPGKTDLFSIPRHHFEADWPSSHVLYFAGGNREVRA